MTEELHDVYEEETVATATRVVTAESRQKQAEAMRLRWQDPEYRARVAAGRAAAKAAKAAAAEQTDEE